MANEDLTPSSSDDPTATATASETSAGSAPTVDGPHETGELRGTTTIADGVVAKIAGIAAREVAGVYALGGGASRALGAIRSAIGHEDMSQGVKVELGENQAVIEVAIVVEYPAAIQDVSDAVREQVTGAIQNVVGLEVVEVNVLVKDVHSPADDQGEQE